MSKELSNGTIIKDTHGNQYRVIDKLSEGAQGKIYELENNLIAKVNYNRDNNRERTIKQLSWIMKRNIPQEARIAKPLAILEKPYTGYIMKRVPEDYVPLSKYINVNTKYKFTEWFNDITGGLKKRFQIANLLAKSLRCLHFEGLTYCDLSPENILISPKKNSVAIIDADNLMSTDIFTSEILGTPGYIAPELLLQAKQPNSLSDVYSFAVLFFELIGMGHPLVGDKILADSPEVEEEAKKGNSVYVNHPTDDSNRSKRATQLGIFLTDEMKDLFQRTFTIGLHNPYKRPALKEFIKAIESALDKLILCKSPNCGGAFLSNLDEGVKCPFCANVEERVDCLKFYRSTSVKGFNIIDCEKIGEFKKMSSVIETPYKMVINKEVTYLRKRHFDIDISLRADDKVLKVNKRGHKKYTVVKLDESLPIYIKVKGENKPMLMKVGEEYDFVFNKTAMALGVNSNLVDGSKLETDIQATGYKQHEDNGIFIREYVAIYY